MPNEFTIDRFSGALCIEDVGLFIPHQEKAHVLSRLVEFPLTTRNHENGYEWYYVQKLQFGGQPCGLGLCFFNGFLNEASWSVHLPDAPEEGGWPTKEAIDAEIKFVLEVLSAQLYAKIPHDFSWGSVWSVFDSKGFFASNGVRYNPVNFAR